MPSSFYNPIDNYRITGNLGDPRPDHVHGGVDMVPATGPANGYPVVSATGGTVTVKPLNGAAGNMVSIDSGDGYVTNYMHLGSFGVQDGQTVVAGQRIGTIGNTGTSSGPHLHYEVVKDGVKQNPIDFLGGRTGPGVPGTPSGPYPPGNTGSPSGSGVGSADQKSTLETRDSSWVDPQEVSRSLDIDETAAQWKSPQDIHEPYYAGAEIRAGGLVIAPWQPLPALSVPLESGDLELPGIDLRILEFRYRYSVEGAQVALITLFMKAWTDVVQTMASCAEDAVIEFRFGYTNIPGGIAGPFFGYVVSAMPVFKQNGYELRLEVHDRAMSKQSMDGAKKKTWRAKSGKVSDIVKVIADQNGWASCIEETMPNDPEKNPYMQNNVPDFTFIKTVLKDNARSNIPRTWITSDGGKGYTPYDVYLQYSPKLGKEVLHFHPGLPQEGSEPAQPVRNYVWGGVIDWAAHEIGTVIDFQPEFNNTAFTQLGGSTMKGVSIDIYKKAVHVGMATGSDYSDSILPGARATMMSNMSTERRTRSISLAHREPDILKSEIARRHFALRDEAYTASLTVVGDPYVHAGMMINVFVMRPTEGVMMFYDWYVVEAVHSIYGGDYRTQMTLKRMAKQLGARATDNVPGLGVGLLDQRSSVSVQTTGLKVGTVYDPDGVQ